MKAAVYDQTGGPEVFRYADIDEPQLRKGGVLIDVKFIGIQGGDLLHRDRKSTRLNSSHTDISRMPSSA